MRYHGVTVKLIAIVLVVLKVYCYWKTPRNNGITLQELLLIIAAVLKRYSYKGDNRNNRTTTFTHTARVISRQLLQLHE